MKPIAKLDFTLDGIFYSKGDEIEPKSKEQIIKLNEKGFIEPLTMKQIQEMFKKPEIRNLEKRRRIDELN